MDRLRLDDVRSALQTRDPLLVDTICALAQQYDLYPRADELPEGSYTIHELRGEVKGWSMRYKPPAEQWEIRREAWAKIAQMTDVRAHPDRLRVNEIIEELHRTEGAFARETLLAVIRRVPLRWGTWRAVKSLYKDSETSGDIELWGALTARIDAEAASVYGDYGEVSRRTLLYMSRRAWRWLRRLGETLPAAYVDAAVAVLRQYDDGTTWARTWVANHIVYHNLDHYGRKAYGGSAFKLWSLPEDLTKDRAYAALWKEDARPLFALLERARSERARSFAIEGLKTDFRAALREVDVETVVRMCAVSSASAHNFVVWLLDHVPRFEQGAFRELGLHEPVLSLLDSQGKAARKYAAKYVQTHARDLPIEHLLRLANHDDDAIRKLAVELLKQHDPRKDVGLAAWGTLLGSPNGHDYAVSMIQKHFGAGELTLAWFRELFASDDWSVSEFAIEMFSEVHKVEKVAPAYFMEMLDAGVSESFAVDCLGEQDVSKLSQGELRRLAAHPDAAYTLLEWIEEGRIEAKDLGVDFWQAVAFEPSWRGFAWARALADDDAEWARALRWRDVPTDEAWALLTDVRNFAAAEVGFEWLMSVVRTGNAEARQLASEYLYDAFALAEFAAQTEVESNSEADLSGKTFLFTGKLATMTRSEAQAKVTGANGKNAGSVTKTLDYLVIGDEGSPLYGEGKKGSKQVKADSLIADGASIAIISETAFLQMLSGGRREYGEADTLAGCEALWEMGCGAEVEADAAEAEFARTYLLRHHEVIGPRLTDMSVEPGRRVPDAFLTLERFIPLFTDGRGAIRKFALEIARHEMARWRPSLDVCLALCETRQEGVVSLISDALLAEETKESERLRIPSDALDPAGAYKFCESLNRATRGIGMALIEKYPHFAEPAALFQLTDSPDRRVRAFVIAAIWRLYRDRHATPTWSPRPLSTEYPVTAKVRYEAGPGLGEVPNATPGSHDAMRDFLRRVLFAVPPGRLPVGESTSGADPGVVAAGTAKLYLVEVMRDIALREQEFARLVGPLLTEFAQSLSKRERGACLVALARIEDRWEVEHV